ncbi:hypothetical protein [Staphylococcus xylosus]|uniref:hypothetical protein n=1 Tax=Staphylococcus xylosus TaxID=1288 RepID=UPI003F57BC3E
MTPREWNDWLIGSRESYLDQLDSNLHSATANGLVQGGKKLKGMRKEIEMKRYEIRGELEEFKAEQERKRAHNRRMREIQKRGAAKFYQQHQNTSQKRG